MSNVATLMCCCAEVQQQKTAEKWGDLTFDADGHCSKCPLCGQANGAPASRMVAGRKTWLPVPTAEPSE